MAYDENEQLVAIYEYSVTGIAQPGNELPATSNYLQFSSYWERADRDDITDHVAFTSRQPGDSVRFQFQGTGFQWYGVRDQYTGLATIYLNGEEIDTVDTYGSTETNVQLYELSDLEFDTYTVTIEINEENNSASHDRNIYLSQITIDK